MYIYRDISIEGQWCQLCPLAKKGDCTSDHGRSLVSFVRFGITRVWFRPVCSAILGVGHAVYICVILFPLLDVVSLNGPVLQVEYVRYRWGCLDRSLLGGRPWCSETARTPTLTRSHANSLNPPHAKFRRRRYFRRAGPARHPIIRTRKGQVRGKIHKGTIEPVTINICPLRRGLPSIHRGFLRSPSI